MRRFAAFGAIFASTLLLDQWSKAAVRDSIPVSGSLGGKPWPGVFEITLTYNEGIAFGMLQGAGIFMSPIAVIIAGLTASLSWRNPKANVWPYHAMLALFASGALGNMIDRIRDGKVTDMFWFRAINFPVFNVADVCISIATLLLLIGAFEREQPAPEPGADGELPAASEELLEENDKST
ncbi:MAG: signal peptidase II [Fimbriimonadaceae bacterium]|nr:signal peptidase II [Fimbriimonadaceae bacterium]